MNKENNNLPTIAIIGRPNVGKSTLFNRIIKRRKAIVSPISGVTRDRNTHVIKLKKRKFHLIDTGGYTLDKDDSFSSYIQSQSLIAMNEADLILFMVEYDSITPDDFELAKVISQTGKDVILLVNKVDSPQRDNYIYQHYELNMGEPLAISAEQGRNIDLLYGIIEEKIPYVEHKEENEEVSSEEPIKVSIIGKPNTGKSSLLNHLLNEERSIVSDIPGTTRDTIEGQINFRDKNILFVDTAGMRRKSKVHEDIEFYSVRRAINSIEKSDIVVLMIDAQDNITDQDKKIAGIALQRLKGLIIVVNKWDLVKHEYKKFANYEDYLRFKFAVAGFVPVVNTSVLQGKNIKKLLDLILKIYPQYKNRVETGEFNRYLRSIIEAWPPPSRKGKFKIYYGTQVQSGPVKFVVFCNNAKNCPSNYKTYIINKIREKYGFNGIPIDLKLKSRESVKTN